MGIFRRGENPNLLAGIFLLVLLIVIAGPSTLPRLTSSLVPFVDEGVPCDWLRRGEDRSMHQSLIGRAAGTELEAPISINIITDPVPQNIDGLLIVTITIINETIGTVPILIEADTVLVDPGVDARSGLGVVFNSLGAIPQASQGPPAGATIRLLGPRQRCIHRISFPVNQLDQVLATGNGTIKAYYRSNSRGTVTPGPGDLNIFSDAGLWVGVVESEPYTIPVSGQ